jgi:hypothetical protein
MPAPASPCGAQEGDQEAEHQDGASRPVDAGGHGSGDHVVGVEDVNGSSLGSLGVEGEHGVVAPSTPGHPSDGDGGEGVVYG